VQPNQTVSHPFLCILSEVIPHSKGAGELLLLRMLENWPAERLVVYGPPPPKGADILSCSYFALKPIPSKVQFSRIAPLAPPLSWLLPSEPPGLRGLPGNTVVLSVMQSSSYYRLAWSVARNNRLPLALIVHDDPEEIEPVRWWSRPLMRRLNGLVYRNAALRFCISPQMSQALQRRYGASSQVLYPIRSSALAPRPLHHTRYLRRNDTFVVGYAGTVSYGYGEALEQLLPLFGSRDITLRVYSSQAPSFAGQSGVEYAGVFEPRELWPRVQQECDAVILPYAGPEHGHQALYRTHFPSKLPEYLALGMPIIITGPTYATGVQWGVDHPHACLTVPSSSRQRFASALERLIENQEYRCRLASGAVEAANGELDPRTIKDVFTASLRNLVHQSAFEAA
jgi:glycosyltransferase involved in cell wall biosynthesis